MVATRRSHEQKPDLFSGTSSNSSGSGSSEEDLPFATKSEDEDPIVQPRKVWYEVPAYLRQVFDFQSIVCRH